MTVVKQLEQAMKERDDLTASVATAIAERDSARADVEKAKAEMAQAVSVHAEAIKAEVDKNAALQAELENAKAQVAEVTAKLETAQKALSNPAFADAGVRGVEAATEEGGQGSGKTFETFAEAHAAYNKIEDAKEKALFRVEHAEILGLK